MKIEVKAVDVLFDEIDKINSQIKAEDKTFKKVMLVFKLKKVIEAIEIIEKIKTPFTYLPKDLYRGSDENDLEYI